MRRMRTFWTAAEDRLFSAIYKTWARTETGVLKPGLHAFLAQKLNRTVSAVANRARILTKANKLKLVRTVVPKLKLSEVDKAWLAGIFDGEGSVVITPIKSTRHEGRFRHHIRVSVHNTDEGILVEVKRLMPLFNRSLSHAKGKLLANGYHSTKDCFTLCISSLAGAKAFLSLVKPYMRQTDKLKSADRILEMQGINGA